MLDIRDAVALLLDDSSIPDDREAQPGNVLALHLGPDDVVDRISMQGAAEADSEEACVEAAHGRSFGSRRPRMRTPDVRTPARTRTRLAPSASERRSTIER